MYVTQEVDDIFGGVSQAPATQRKASEATEQINAYTYRNRQLGRRAPMVHLAKIAAAFGGAASVFIHSFSRTASERYHVAIANGAIKVFDAVTGAEQTVVSPSGLGYLAGYAGFRAVSVGDDVFIANRSIVTQRDTRVVANVTPGALLTVKQGDFSCVYTVTIESTNYTYTTPGNSAAADKLHIATDYICAQLATAIGTGPGAAYTVTNYGSTLYIVRNDAGEFAIQTKDGLGDRGLQAVKNVSQRLADLPDRAPMGYLCEVLGDPSAQQYSYWVQFDDAQLPGKYGVWRETPAPGSLKGLLKTTLPFRLSYKGPYLDKTKHDSATRSSTVFSCSTLALATNVHAGRTIKNISDGSSATVSSNTATTVTCGGLSGGGRNTFAKGDVVQIVGTGTYFLFDACSWADRAAGDATSAPDPSFIGNTINDVFVYQSRLGLLSQDKVVFSQAGNLFNLYRQTITDILDSDPIDVHSALNNSGTFHSALQWNNALWLWTETKQFRGPQDNTPLTPRTVAMEQVSEYPNLGTVRPVAAGNRVFFMGLKGNLARVMEYSMPYLQDHPKAEPMTDTIPTYITGVPQRMVVDDSLGILVVHTALSDGSNGELFVHSYKDGNVQEGRVSAAWSKWSLLGTSLAVRIAGIDLVDGFLAVLTQHTDGLFLNSIGLDPYGDASLTLPSQAAVVGSGALSTISVSPSSTTVAQSASQTFTATGRDSLGNVVTITPVWTASAGSINSSTGVFTAPAAAASVTITATVGSIYGQATVTVPASGGGALATIVVSPSAGTMNVSTGLQFTAIGRDGGSNVVGFTPVWTCSSGTITSGGGYFTASGTPASVTITCTCGAISGTATVTTIAGTLVSIAVSSTTAIHGGGTNQFTATGTDSLGNAVAITPVWSVVNGGGTISPTGLFTAGLVSGTYSATVKATALGVAGYASVTVSVGATTSIVINPASASITAGSTYQFTASCYDSYGVLNSVAGVVWNTDAYGSIDYTGFYTDAGSIGTRSTAVSATSGGITAYATVVTTAAQTSIVVSPNPETATPSGTINFGCVASDAYGNQTTLVGTRVWSMTRTGAGTINSSTGVFTAPAATDIGGPHSPNPFASGATLVDVVQVVCNGMTGYATINYPMI